MKKLLLQKNKLNNIVLLISFFCFSAVYGITRIVTVSGMSFSPSTFTCNVGDVVHWTNLTGHTSTSTSIPAGANAWNGAGTTTFDYTVTVAGTYTYVCTPHQFFGNFIASAPVNSVIHNVTVSGMSFSPSTFTCNVGDIVHWTNLTGHTTTSASVPAGANTWDGTGTATFDYTVTVAGTYTYVCTPHQFFGSFTAFDASAGIGVMSEQTFFTIYPNPVKNSFQIQYSIESNSDIEISANDLNGKKIETFFTGKKSPGVYKETLHINQNFSSGIYLLNIRIGNQNHTQKIIIQ